MMKRAAGRVRDTGAKAVDTAKQHPIASALLGAGLAAGAAVLTARAVRNASSSQAAGGRQAGGRAASTRGADEQSEDQGDQGAAADEAGGDDVGEDDDDGGDDDDDDDDDEDDENKNRNREKYMKRRSRDEYEDDERGRDEDRGDGVAAPFWKEHPLLVASALAIVGLAAGMALPVSQAERNLSQAMPGNWPRRLRRSTRSVLKEGRVLARHLVEETTSAASEAVAEVGLTPDRIARKVRKITQRVQAAATQALAG
jgi:hypothetical protein